jgi:hypothetical protein
MLAGPLSDESCASSSINIGRVRTWRACIQSAAQSRVPSLSAAVICRRRPPPLLSSSTTTVFRCRYLCRSHHRQSAVSAISCRQLLSFPVIVRRPILQAVIICHRHHPPPLSSAVTVVVCRCGLPPLQPSWPLNCLWHLLPPLKMISKEKVSA